MKNLMNLAILCSSAFLLTANLTFAQPDGITQTSGLDCFEAYHFCARYPSSTLSLSTPLPDGNGITLHSADGFSEVMIGGFPLSDDLSTKSLFLASAREKTAAQLEPKVISALFGEDFYECYFMIDRAYYFHQCFVFEDYFVQLEIKVPINMPDKLLLLRQQIHLEFGPVQPTNKVSTGAEIGGLRD